MRKAFAALAVAGALSVGIGAGVAAAGDDSPRDMTAEHLEQCTAMHEAMGSMMGAMGDGMSGMPGMPDHESHHRTDG